MDEQLRTNLAMWNEMVAVHARSQGYRMAEFKAGSNVLNVIERAEVGDVVGKSLLHLQCHFGLDTMSWARLGAKVTGADFSDKAIELGRSLSRELRIPAEFVCSPISELRGAIEGRFDIVFTSYGALCWLPDLERWAEVIAHFLKPGGFFYVIDVHPFVNIFRNEADARELKIEFSYFRREMIEYAPGYDYSDPTAKRSHPSHEWIHSIESIVGPLIAAGLRIEFLHEFPAIPWRFFPFCSQDGDGMWRIPGDPIPLLFSIRAARPLLQRP